MNNEKIIPWFLLFSVIGGIVGHILTNSIKYGICISNATVTEASCINFYERVGDPLFFGMGALAVVFFVLWLAPQAYDAWRKFAIWFVPLAALLFIFYRNPGSGDLFSPYPETVFTWVSGFYILISLLIIFTARKK